MVQHSNPSRPPEPLTVILQGHSEDVCVGGETKKHKCYNLTDELHVCLCVLLEKCFKLKPTGTEEKKLMVMAPGEGADKKVSQTEKLIEGQHPLTVKYRNVPANWPTETGVLTVRL